jgi:hypothetical protein
VTDDDGFIVELENYTDADADAHTAVSQAIWVHRERSIVMMEDFIFPPIPGAIRFSRMSRVSQGNLGVR